MKGSGNYTEYYAPDGTVKGKDYTGKWRSTTMTASA